MKNSKLIQASFLQSVGVLAYVSLVAWIMTNGEKIFGQMKSIWGPVLFLLLFVFSALVTSLLVLGRPIWLYLQGEKKDAVGLLFYTAGWMFFLLVLVFGINILIK
ncbi:hypothetical protein COV49_04245 [Candidatus Falkowbacteria bacterium CG11_big_fil_rev_8_21_14_0_20_39_10]|uniref:Uncharacterized protein n=1 Tax=Candidatus Falkowbacteria bacterium CG11_big_fil_rev_8_21_14_0_20_39_10 TaxID=1974570 RepID=A0A2M6K7Y7_9BACT|nr:MAG: hypothetical protein COV49_04245 [Candidatus Falkowbacteria bacterium CG11_big_fil_rev_8_21_14_0_20_39_10]